MKFIELFIVSFLLVSAGHVAAQSSAQQRHAYQVLEGTTAVTSMNQSHDGLTDSCGFEFRALSFDNAYKQGAPLMLSGSFSIHKSKSNQVSIWYKLGTFSNSDAGLKPEKHHSAWIKLGGVLLKPQHNVEGEAPYYRLYVSELPRNFEKVIEAVSTQKNMTLGFNRVEGGLDVVVPIDLSVRDTNMKNGKAERVRNDKMGRDFASCLVELASEMK